MIDRFCGGVLQPGCTRAFHCGHQGQHAERTEEG